jgi:nucleoside-diphosphate-sugar epimerase
MIVLVTGGSGYLGSVLIPKLLLRGHQVRVIDAGYFDDQHLRSLWHPVELIRDDLSRIIDDLAFCDTLLDGCDAVIHLAAISNDISAELAPELTERVNIQTTQVLAERARQKGIRFLFSSSCSIYGEGSDELHEYSPVNPLTLYAASKVSGERILDELADRNWKPIILRNGTLFGYSPRMRFDLVVNTFSLHSILYNEIRVVNGGRQWRPFLHINDCARAFVHFLEQREFTVRCFNIAHENVQIRDVATIFQCINPYLKVSYVDSLPPDSRDYRVATVKMREAGFVPHYSIVQGAEQLSEILVRGMIPDPESSRYRNVEHLRLLLRSKA